MWNQHDKDFRIVKRKQIFYKLKFIFNHEPFSSSTSSFVHSNQFTFPTCYMNIINIIIIFCR